MKVVLKLIGALSLLFCLLTIASAGNEAPPLQNRFEWVSYDTGERVLERAAMAVPIYFRGSHQKLYAQLDTGSDATIFYGQQLRQWGISIDSADKVMIEFSWTGKGEFDSCSSHVIWDQSETVDTTSSNVDGRIVGTIGADLIQGRILLIDFPHREFSVVSDTSFISAELKSSVQFISTSLRNGRLWVRPVMGADTLGWTLYDTGSSETELSLPLKDWQRYTQRMGTESDVIRDSVPAWGKYLQSVRAPGQSDLVIGQIRIEKPLLEHVEFADSSLNEWRILGNAAFYDDYIVIYDAKYQRFGIAPGRK